jgi:hypothetical protein
MDVGGKCAHEGTHCGGGLVHEGTGCGVGRCMKAWAAGAGRCTKAQAAGAGWQTWALEMAQHHKYELGLVTVYIQDASISSCTPKSCMLCVKQDIQLLNKIITILLTCVSTTRAAK